MLAWISAHSSVLQVVLNAIMTAVWVLYLQIFLSSFRRQRRSEITVTYGGAAGPKASWFVANLGLEPVFIVEVIVQLRTKDRTRDAAVTDRLETKNEDSSPLPATNHGPLTSGAFMCIGSRDAIMRRAREQTGITGDIEAVKVLIIAATAASDHIVGASREYRFVTKDDGQEVLAATSIATRQIVRRSEVRELKQKLEGMLA